MCLEVDQTRKNTAPFISNQVREITQLQGTKFCYVLSRENPADIGQHWNTLYGGKDHYG